MVELIMIFALGALAAALLALAGLPALDRRAQRLARRRLEALFPMSIAEIAAERDHVRAAMAVEARRSELKAEAAAREKAADLAELGRRAVSIHRLTETVAARDFSISENERELTGVRVRLLEASAKLEANEAKLAETEQALGALRAAHQDLSARHEASERDLGEHRLALARARGDLSETQNLLDTRNEAYATLQRDLRQAKDSASERLLNIAGLELRLEAQIGDARDAARRLNDARETLSQREAAIENLVAERDEAKRLAVDLQGRLTEARAAIVRLEAQMRKIEEGPQTGQSEQLPDDRVVRLSRPPRRDRDIKQAAE